MSSEPELTRAALRRLGQDFALVAAAAYALVVLGALVRAHDAGLACPDWPLCHGVAVPAFDLEIALEWSHRVLAGAVSLGLAILALRVLRRPAARARVGGAVAFVMAALLVQVVLGGLTVLLGLAPWTVTAHLVSGQLFAATLAWISVGLLEGELGRQPLSAALACGVALASGLVVAQIVLGGLVASQYAGLACATFPLCNGDSLAPTFLGPVGLHVIHRLNAYAVCAAFAGLAWGARRNPRIARLARLGLGLLLLQVAVGVANVLLRLPVPVTALHSALAAAIALACTLLVRETVLARAFGRDETASLPAGAFGGLR